MFIRYLIHIVFSILLTTTSIYAKHINTMPENKKKSLSYFKNNIKIAIKDKDLDLADQLYLDMRDEYMESTSVPNIIFKLIDAHIDAHEYLLSRYYSESYIKDYPEGRRVQYASFLKVKSLFLRFKNNNNKQEIIDQLELELKDFLSYYTKGKYSLKVKKMKTEFEAIKENETEKIAMTYEKLGKLKAAEYYRSKLKKEKKYETRKKKKEKRKKSALDIIKTAR